MSLQLLPKFGSVLLADLSRQYLNFRKNKCIARVWFGDVRGIAHTDTCMMRVMGFHTKNHELVESLLVVLPLMLLLPLAKNRS